MSEHNAGLKLNGAYMGLIGKFEKFADIPTGDKILAEAVPEGDALPVSFFIDDGLFTSPPEFADVYLLDGDAVVYISRYEKRTRELKVITQTDFSGGRYTLFLNGGKVYLNCEKGECSLYDLPASFENARFKEARIGGYPVLLVEGAGALVILSDEGKRIFFNPAESWECGENLKITVNFYTCAGCKAECTFAYDGRQMTLKDSRTREFSPPEKEIIHFAFFESVLTRGDFAKYLTDELKVCAAAMPEFLGEFTDVILPYGKFYEKHGNLKAAGLVYPVKRNLFSVKYFAVDMKDGLIANVYEVQ